MWVQKAFGAPTLSPWLCLAPCPSAAPTYWANATCAHCPSLSCRSMELWLVLRVEKFSRSKWNNFKCKNIFQTGYLFSQLPFDKPVKNITLQWLLFVAWNSERPSDSSGAHLTDQPFLSKGELCKGRQRLPPIWLPEFTVAVQPGKLGGSHFLCWEMLLSCCT